MLFKSSGNMGEFADTGGGGATLDMTISDLSGAIIFGPAPATISISDLSGAVVIGPSPSTISISDLLGAVVHN